MKYRLTTLLLLFLTLTLSLSGCKRAAVDAPESADKPALRVDANDKAIIVYFSRTGDQYKVGRILEGNTAIVAGMIAEKTGAELYEVKPQDRRYDLEYNQLATVAKKEQDDKVRPEYLTPTPDLNDYDVIFFGSPVWWGDWPMIMYTFFENNELSGKKLIPFTTHEGSELSGFDAKLSNAYPYCNILKGAAFEGTLVQSDREKIAPLIDEWLAQLGFTLDAHAATESEPDANVDATTDAE